MALAGKRKGRIGVLRGSKRALCAQRKKAAIAGRLFASGIQKIKR
jgi:hypothetical protein